MDEIENYLIWLRSRNRTERTLENKRKVLRATTRFLRDHERNYSAYDITAEDVRYYLDNSDVKESTKKVYCRELGLFIKYYTGTDIVQDMCLMWNRVQRNRLFITKEDMIAVYRVAEPRVRLMIVLGAFMGLRTIEMERMKWDDITLDHIRLRGKGHNSGFVMDQPMSEAVWDELMSYKSWMTKKLSLLGYEDRTEGHVFFLYDKVSGIVRPLEEGSTSLHRLLKFYGDKVNVQITPHSLRRLYATTLYYEHKVDLMTLKTLMRHASVKTTFDNYVAPMDSKKKEVMKTLDDSMKGLLKEVKEDV